MGSDNERRIRERAYDIWVREGRPHGRDAEHWRMAEAEIAAEEGAEVGADARPATAGSGRGGGDEPTARAAPVRSRRAATRSGRGGARETQPGGDSASSAPSGRKPLGT